MGVTRLEILNTLQKICQTKDLARFCADHEVPDVLDHGYCALNPSRNLVNPREILILPEKNEYVLHKSPFFPFSIKKGGLCRAA